MTTPAWRALFPQAWPHLLRAKTFIDAVAALDAPAAATQPAHLTRVAPLLTAAAAELDAFAVAHLDPSDDTVRVDARSAARRLRGYAHAGTWDTVLLQPPTPDRPWFYCGPLNTWGMHRSHTSIALILVRPRPDLQAAVDTVSAEQPRMQAVVREVLGGPISTVAAVAPTMNSTDLILAGGESVYGHKNFAHFFPLEAAATAVSGPEFTVVFANVHEQRLRLCSTELATSYQQRQASVDARQTLKASLQWFRCHDLSHFWRRDPTPGVGVAGLSPFEAITLEEAYADTLGLICAARLVPSEALSHAFTAELLRYLSRRHDHFADSAAAMLTIGWMRNRAVFPDVADGWLAKPAQAALADLVRALHGALWDADESGLPAIRAAYRTGQAFMDGVAPLYRRVPTDIGYTFG